MTTAAQIAGAWLLSDLLLVAMFNAAKRRTPKLPGRRRRGGVSGQGHTSTPSR